MARGRFNADSRDDLVIAQPEGDGGNGDTNAATGLPIDDVAIGCPFHDTSGQSDAGEVLVVYGTTSGLNASGSGSIPAAQRWSQDSAGIDGVAEADDAFGWALAAGDFDADGKDDLVVGVPYEDSQVGAVHVIRGTSSGLSSANDQFLYSGSSFGLNYTSTGADRFGYSLATGKFNSTGGDDLIIGAPRYDVGAANEAGAVVVVYSASGTSGLTGTGSLVIHQDSNKVAGTAESGDWCGSSVTTGDFNGDGSADIAFGCTGESVVSGQSQNGAYNVNYGPSFTASSSQAGEIWYQDNSGVGTSHSSAQFGYALCTGRFNADSKDDVVSGAPTDSGGTVTLLMGN